MLDTVIGRNGLRRVRARILLIGLAGGAVLTMYALQPPRLPSHTRPDFNAPSASMPRLTSVVWQTPGAKPSQPQSTPTVKTNVDSGASLPADPVALRNMIAGVGSSQEKSAGTMDAPWYGWGHLEAGRIMARVTAPSDFSPDAMGVYAVRSENGVTLCLVNHTDARLNTTSALRLGRGVYVIERLTILQGKGEREKEKGEEGAAVSRPANPAFVSASSSSYAAPERLERLEGCELGAAGVVSKSMCLEPHEMCLYRCTDVSRAARASWAEVFGQVSLMARDHPTQSHRLQTMLREADGYISGVRGATGHGSLESRLGCVHHLLLVTAQAHSLHHNYQMRHTVDEAEGRAVMAALDRLTDALSETSAALLGLIPQMDVTPAPTQPSLQAGGADVSSGRPAVQPVSFPTPTLANKADTKEEKPRTTPKLALIVAGTAAANERVVTVTLANMGARRIANVKLGLNTNALPSGVVCEPSDPAYFSALPPGQTIRAMFHLRASNGQTLPNTPITGDVSYFAGTAPAHLRPRAW